MSSFVFLTHLKNSVVSTSRSPAASSPGDHPGAAATHRNVTVEDVSKEEGYLPNSPDTQSEIVTLIRAGDDIYGAIDIDSETVDAFNEEDEIALISIADKLAEQLAAERR